MNEKELIEKLKMLKEVRLEASWKQESRGVLLSQISNAVSEEVRFGFANKLSYFFKSFFSFVPRSAWAGISMLVILVSGALSVYAANYSKPGDSLYTARILKEKAQLAMTFNQEDKARLDMKMANNHAKEISEVLANPKYKGDDKKAEQLAQNFEQEINTVKERLSEIGKIQSENAVVGKPLLAVNKAVSNPVANNDDVKVGIGDAKEDDHVVHVVESGKDDKGIQISIPDTGKIGALSASKIPTTTIAGNTSIYPGVSSTENVDLSAPVATMNVSDEITTSLDKATESFNTEDFSGAQIILEQVGAIIENIGTGEVKGVTEVGSSSAGTEISAGGIGSSSANK